MSEFPFLFFVETFSPYLSYGEYPLTFGGFYSSRIRILSWKRLEMDSRQDAPGSGLLWVVSSVSDAEPKWFERDSIAGSGVTGVVLGSPINRFDLEWTLFERFV